MIKFKLREIMEKRNIKISDLHQQTGISRNSLSLLINGKSQGIQFDTLERIIDALNVGVGELLEKTFDSLTINIVSSEVVKEIDLNRLEDSNSEKIFKTRFNLNEDYALKCIVNIDGKESNYFFPYRFSVIHYPQPILKLEINIKNYDIKNTFKTFCDLNEGNGILLVYYFVNKIFELEVNRINDLITVNNIYKDMILCSTDVFNVNKNIYLPLTKKRQINRKDINYVIDMVNYNKTYATDFNDSLTVSKIKKY